MQRVARIAFIFVTALLLLVALLQVLGRGFAYFASDLQPHLNNYLSAQKISVEKVVADWHLLNPVVKISKVNLPAGDLEGLHIELDWLESIWRRQWVFRRLYVASFDVAIARTETGRWYLANMQPGEAQFDWVALLNHSDEVIARGQARFLDPSLVGDVLPVQAIDTITPAKNALEMSFWASNRRGGHLVNAHVANLDCGLGCGLSLDYQNFDALKAVRPHSSRLNLSGSINLPSLLTAGRPIRVEDLQLNSSDTNAQSQWSSRFVVLHQHAKLTIGGQGVSFDGLHHGSLDQISVTTGEQTVTLPEVQITSDSTSAWLNVAKLDLTQVSQFIEAAAGQENLTDWLQTLAISGRLDRLAAFVDLASGAFGFSADANDVALQGYKGVPTIRQGSGYLVGTQGTLALTMNGTEQHLHFPEIFNDGWDIRKSTGTLTAWFGGGYFGLRGDSMDINVPFADQQTSAVLGGFALARPPDVLEQRLTLSLEADQADVAFAKKLVPAKLNPEIREWLVSAPSAGQIQNITYAMHGHFKSRPNDGARRIALQSDFSGADLAFHPHWPEVTRATGHLEFSGGATVVRLDNGRSQGFSIGGSSAKLAGKPLMLQLQLSAHGAGDGLIDYVQRSPLKNWLSFVSPQWRSSGAVSVAGQMQIPLAQMGKLNKPTDANQAGGSSPINSQISIDARIELAGVDLHMPEYRLDFTQLQGGLNYRYPYAVTAQQITGQLFDLPVVVNAMPVLDANNNQVIQLGVTGEYTAADLYTVIDVPDPGFADGSSKFSATLDVPVTTESVVELKLQSNLAGLAVALPEPFGKVADIRRNTDVAIAFLPDYQQVEIDQGENHAWLQISDKVLRGGLGLGESAPDVSPNAREFWVSGEVDYLNLVAYASLNKNGKTPALAAQVATVPGPLGIELPIPVRLQGLKARKMSVDSFVVEDALMDGRIAHESLAIDISSARLAGTLRQHKTQPYKLLLSRVEIPASEDFSAEDPLDVTLIPQLPNVDVVVEQLSIGGEDYGSWRFNMAGEGDLLWLRNLQGLMRGVQIRSDALLWNGEVNESSFVGDLIVGDLANVLPQWGYAASVESKSAVMNADIGWPGSPVNVQLAALTGSAVVGARHGRFLDVEAGNSAMRIFSLLNFSTIAKRISLDFSDVRGRGISFDTLSAEVAFGNSKLTFVEPMDVEGTGSNFRVAGSIDLATGALDNELIVTLPVGKGLPWYGVYLALANPLAGLGVIVGEQVLRKPIEQFSSAKYEIGGTLEHPTAQLVKVFDTSMREQDLEPNTMDGAVEEAASDHPAKAEKPGEPVPQPETAPSKIR